jgi:hypothetical protein
LRGGQPPDLLQSQPWSPLRFLSWSTTRPFLPLIWTPSSAQSLHRRGSQDKSLKLHTEIQLSIPPGAPLWRGDRCGPKRPAGSWGSRRVRKSSPHYS